MRKRILSFLFVLVIACGSCITVSASEISIKDKMLELLEDAQKQAYIYEGYIGIQDITEATDFDYVPEFGIDVYGGIEDGNFVLTVFESDSFYLGDFIDGYFEYGLHDLEALKQEDYIDDLGYDWYELSVLCDKYVSGIFFNLSDDYSSFMHITDNNDLTVVEKPFEKGMISIAKYFADEGIKYFPIRSDEDYFEAKAILTKEMTKEFEEEFAGFLDGFIFNGLDIEDIKVGSPSFSFIVNKETRLIEYMLFSVNVDYTAYGKAKTMNVNFEADVMEMDASYLDGYSSMSEAYSTEIGDFTQGAEITEEITPVIDYMKIIGEALTWEKLLDR